MSLPLITIEPLLRSDCATLASWLPDPYALVMTAPDWSFPFAAADIERAYAEQFEKGEALKAVSDGRMVGHLGLRVLSHSTTGHLFHVIVDPARRGQGYGSAMMRAVIHLAFFERDLRRLQLHVFDDNAPAIACYIRAGFQIEGHHVETTRFGDRWLSTYSMALLRHEWERSQRTN